MNKTKIIIIIALLLVACCVFFIYLNSSTSQIKFKKIIDEDLIESYELNKKPEGITEESFNIVEQEKSINIVSEKEMEIIEKERNELISEEYFLVKDENKQTVSKYEKRFKQGTIMGENNELLRGYFKIAQPIALQIVNLSVPSIPENNQEIWIRAHKIYNWLGLNFKFCADKAIDVDGDFVKFQFFSPDELLSSNGDYCGDCDDYAALFAGLMYSTGVPENIVWYVFGQVDEGGHAWNKIILGYDHYIVDSSCSRNNKFKYYGNSICHTGYISSLRMNPGIVIKENI